MMRTQGRGRNPWLCEKYTNNIYRLPVSPSVGGQAEPGGGVKGVSMAQVQLYLNCVDPYLVSL